MSIETVFLLAVAACAAVACRDPRLHAAAPWQVLAAAIGAAAAPAMLCVVLLALADLHAPIEPTSVRALAASVGVGALVGGLALTLREAAPHWADHGSTH